MEAEEIVEESFAWGHEGDMPLRFHYPVSDELVEACKTILESLFDRYPVRMQSERFVSGMRVDGHNPHEWRYDALNHTERRDINNAFLYADNTGVPRDELISAMLLLGAVPREEE
jgi:hypothetical protein